VKEIVRVPETLKQVQGDGLVALGTTSAFL